MHRSGSALMGLPMLMGSNFWSSAITQAPCFAQAVLQVMKVLLSLSKHDKTVLDLALIMLLCPRAFCHICHILE